MHPLQSESLVVKGRISSTVGVYAFTTKPTKRAQLLRILTGILMGDIPHLRDS